MSGSNDPRWGEDPRDRRDDDVAIDSMKTRARLGEVRPHPVRETTTRRTIPAIATMTREGPSATATMGWPPRSRAARDRGMGA
jgi:hypothetical protein